MMIARTAGHEFAMPGTGIPDFAAHSKAIANAGIYDFALHHEQILVPIVLQHWNIAAIEGLDAEAEQARAHRDLHRQGRPCRRE
ncbi:MAG: acyl-ACP desaturase [Acidimicrobiales bacterium]